ncbi:hypothetical protein DPV78_008352 [Talaromyces pinophilus]|nr:hypothetical protein DPV78_008352 [Talaromyces pinophilus]
MAEERHACWETLAIPCCRILRKEPLRLRKTLLRYGNVLPHRRTYTRHAKQYGSIRHPRAAVIRSKTRNLDTSSILAMALNNKNQKSSCVQSSPVF